MYVKCYNQKSNWCAVVFLCMLNLFLVVYCFDKRVTLSFTWFILVYKICTTSMYFIDCSTCTSDSMMLNMYTFTVILTRLDGWLQPLYSISHLQKSYTIYLHSIWRGIINQYQILFNYRICQNKTEFYLIKVFWCDLSLKMINYWSHSLLIIVYKRCGNHFIY